MSIASTASLCYFNDSVGVPPEKNKITETHCLFQGSSWEGEGISLSTGHVLCFLLKIRKSSQVTYCIADEALASPVHRCTCSIHHLNSEQ